MKLLSSPLVCRDAVELVSDYLDGFIRHTEADEVIVAHQAPTIEGRLRSVTLLAEAMQAVPA